MERKITVLGAGSSGMATAAWMTLEGYRVTLWDTPEQSADFDDIYANGGIQLCGGSGRNGTIMPECLSHDLEAALADTDCILVCTSALRHRELWKLCVPIARSGQTFLIAPGNFGSFSFRSALDAVGKKDVLVAETCGGLWASRRTAPGQVIVTSPLKKNIRFAALPCKDNERIADCFEGILSLKQGKNVLEVSLNSPNVITHVCGSVLNVAEIERKKEAYAFFLDGLSESVITCFGKLEEERGKIMEKLGLEVYSPSSRNFMNRLMEYGRHEELDLFRSLDGPSSFQHRYVAEDASCGVALLVSVSRQYKIPAPLTEAFLTVAQAITDTDYLETGRTLKNLGIAESTPEMLLQLL